MIFIPHCWRPQNKWQMAANASVNSSILKACLYAQLHYPWFSLVGGAAKWWKGMNMQIGLSVGCFPQSWMSSGWSPGRLSLAFMIPGNWVNRHWNWEDTLFNWTPGSCQKWQGIVPSELKFGCLTVCFLVFLVCSIDSCIASMIFILWLGSSCLPTRI